MKVVLLWATGTIRPGVEVEGDPAAPPPELQLVGKDGRVATFHFWKAGEAGQPFYEQVDGDRHRTASR